MTIERKHSGPRMSQVGIHGDVVYLAGQVRSTGRQSRQAAIQSVVNKIHAVWHVLQANETADLWVRGSRGMAHLDSEVERVRFSAFIFSILFTSTFGLTGAGWAVFAVSLCHMLIVTRANLTLIRGMGRSSGQVAG